MTTPKPAPQPVYGTFCAPIDPGSAQRFAHWLDVASQGGVPEAHILFQSTGGSVGDGIFLYSLFRALPFDLTLYNGGAVQSIASVAFLGAKHRRVSHSGVFMLHHTFFQGLPLDAEQTRIRGHTLAVDDQRTEAILREHLRLDAAMWDDLKRNELWFTAEEAVRVGFADAIGDFAPPLRGPLADFNAP